MPAPAPEPFTAEEVAERARTVLDIVERTTEAKPGFKPMLIFLAFKEAVPAVGDTADYYDRIKNPMWFDRVRAKIAEGAYGSDQNAFAADMRLIVANCREYNANVEYLRPSQRAHLQLHPLLLRLHRL